MQDRSYSNRVTVRQDQIKNFKLVEIAKLNVPKFQKKTMLKTPSSFTRSEWLN